MGIGAVVQDGKIQESASAASIANSRNTKNGNYDKDTFLHLLVAEVQNQDPLEPTTNTEWVSQYATFSELESMQNMSASYDLSRASGLVGKTVVMNVGNDAEGASLVQGRVDYVTYENNKAYLSIEGQLYSIEDLYNVLDTEYLNAYDKVAAWSKKLSELPSVTGSVTLDHRDAVTELALEYDSMSEYEQGFVSQDDLQKMQLIVNRMSELIKGQQAKDEAEGTDG